MAKRNSSNQDYSNLADGWDLSGGTTARKLTLTGGDVTITGAGSATITFPSSTGTLYATNNTDVALADGGTGASLADPNADRIMFWDDSAATMAWLEVGSGLSLTGTTLTASASTPKQPYDYIIYKNGADTVAYKTSDGSTLSTNSDASVPIQAAVDACDATSGTGGRIYIQPGTYALNTVITCQGDQTSDSEMVSIHGSGVQTTIIKPAVNANGFTFSQRAKFSIKDMAIIVRGSGSGITTTNSVTTNRACWQSEIKNIYIYDDASSTAHSGWGLDLGNFFRSVVENVEMNQVKNGMRLSALGSSAFNPGDSTFTRMFIELQSGATSGTGIHLSSNVGGRMNQMNFSMIELIGTGTGQTAILLDGTAGNNYNRFWGINVEEFATILDIQYGRGNTFDFNYIITIDAAATTYFKTTINAFANRISAAYAETYTQTVTMINDAQTSFNERNRFENISMQGTATTVTFTRVDATYLYNIHDNTDDGTKSVVINTGTSGSVSANAVTVQGIVGSFTDTTDINADTTRTAITLNNNAIRSSSIVSAFMMSAPDTNAMLVASVVPADGSATIYVRNVGTGNQTATWTLGFIVQQ